MFTFLNKSAVASVPLAMVMSVITSGGSVMKVMRHPTNCALVGLYNTGTHAYSLPDTMQHCDQTGCTTSCVLITDLLPHNCVRLTCLCSGGEVTGCWGSWTSDEYGHWTLACTRSENACPDFYCKIRYSIEPIDPGHPQDFETWCDCNS